MGLRKEGAVKFMSLAVCLFAERITVEELLFLVRFSNFNQLPDSIGYLRERGNRTMAASCSPVKIKAQH